MFVERTREVVPTTLEAVIPSADLIVYGRVAPVRTYLSDDQRELFTDYLFNHGWRIVTSRDTAHGVVMNLEEPFGLIAAPSSRKSLNESPLDKQPCWVYHTGCYWLNASVQHSANDQLPDTCLTHTDIEPRGL